MKLIDPLGLGKLSGGAASVDGVADGYESFVLAQIAAEVGQGRPVIFVARDGQRLPQRAEAIRFADPGLPVLELPAWDCLPYDRVSRAAGVGATPGTHFSNSVACSARIASNSSNSACESVSM